MKDKTPTNINLVPELAAISAGIGIFISKNFGWVDFPDMPVPFLGNINGEYASSFYVASLYLFTRGGIEFHHANKTMKNIICSLFTALGLVMSVTGFYFTYQKDINHSLDFETPVGKIVQYISGGTVPAEYGELALILAGLGFVVFGAASLIGLNQKQNYKN